MNASRPLVSGKTITYSLLTFAAMVGVLFIVTSGAMAEYAWPKFMIPLVTAAGILLYLKSEYDRKDSGLRYFRAMTKAFIMSILAFGLFTVVLFFVLGEKSPAWIEGLHTSPLMATLFIGLTGLFMNFILVLIILPFFKRKSEQFREDPEQFPKN